MLRGPDPWLEVWPNVVAPDETQPDPKKWQVKAPAAGSTEQLVVTFPKPLDHGMLERVLWVTDDAGRKGSPSSQRDSPPGPSSRFHTGRASFKRSIR